MESPFGSQSLRKINYALWDVMLYSLRDRYQNSGGICCLDRGQMFFQNIDTCLPDYILLHPIRGTAVAQWLRCCATNQKVTGSIPDGVIGIFH